MLEFVELFKIIISVYPKKQELTQDRLVKLTYLSDWRSAIVNKKQITNIKWYINNYGPYIENMYDILEEKSFDINDSIIKRKKFDGEIATEIMTVVDFIINKTKELNNNDFTTLVFSTFPLATSTKYSHVDLVEKAKQYQSEEK